MSFWKFIKNEVVEAIDKAITGLEPYRYGVLPTKRSIRLLSMEPDEEWTYSLSMSIFELDKAPPFSALSYTWDTPHQWPHLEENCSTTAWDRFEYWEKAYSRSMSFKCNGKRIIVRPGRNLDEVLTRLCNAGETLNKCEYLWVDAICIDQADLDERKAQVLLMADIYKRAETVIAWLGEDLDDTARGIQALDKLAEIPFAKHKEMQNLSLREPTTYKALGVDPIKREDMSCLAGFLGRRWFNRVWIVQEAVFAQQILFLCGDYTIDPKTLFNVGKLLCLSGWAQQFMDTSIQFRDIRMPPPGAVATLALMREELNGERQSSLLNIMTSTRSRQATNPLDNAYGMLNVLALVMGKAPASLEVQPDYKRSVPGVMEDTTRLLIRHEGNLDVFHQVQDHSVLCSWDRPGTSFASWTVHWGERMEPQPFKMLSQFSTAWKPSGSMPKEIPDTHTPHQLTFRAACIGNLQNIEDTYYLLPQVELAVELSGRPYGVRTKQGLSEILWRTTLADCAGPQHPAPAGLGDSWVAHMLDQHHTYSKGLGGGTAWRNEQDTHLQRLLDQMRVTDPETKFPTVEHAKTVLSAMRGERGADPMRKWSELQKTAAPVRPFLYAANQCRKIARTDNLLTLVPKSTKLYDSVWIVPGLSTPFVLRKSKDYYELVGEAYVHGIMRGEMAKDLKFDTITLR
ncbi:heterokaryon incompatibility protein-domain-containing protein [Lophiotrema nucula]|uniref:Heterokaryon incompatibility protein-domain-containing protein n=1 Tax=Lophiotrema nucula TaxID=690887 RepID=A0A6A5Z8D1_9PLEO|nr:heterokaryon incompatibility protein-domain-containing protein [Lophiotrema nucula]